MKLFTYYRYRLIFSAGRARARAVLDVLVLDLALVVVVVWEEYQGKRLACPLLQRPGGAAPSETQSEAIRGHQEAIKRPSRGN